MTAPSSQMYVWMDVAEVVLVVSRQAGSGPNRYWSETVILDSYRGGAESRRAAPPLDGGVAQVGATLGGLVEGLLDHAHPQPCGDISQSVRVISTETLMARVAKDAECLIVGLLIRPVGHQAQSLAIALRSPASRY